MAVPHAPRVQRQEQLRAARGHRHWPSFLAFTAAGFGPCSLCRFHIPRCLDNKIVELGIKDAAAAALHCAFRIMQRAESGAQARVLRTELVKWMYAESIQEDNLFIFEQVQGWVQYFDKCWIYAPLCIVRAWIDEAGLGVRGFLSTSGICEASHTMWVKHLFQCFQNKLVSAVVSRTVGVAFDGTATAGMFPENQRRTESGTKERGNEHMKLNIMRSRLEFLSQFSNAAAAAPPQGASVRTPRFKTSGICSSSQQLHGGWRDLMSEMLRVLQHGGAAAVGIGPAEVAVERDTWRCSCQVGVYFGVLLARGACKHALLLALRDRAQSEGWRAVALECAKLLGKYVWSREVTKKGDAHAAIVAAAKAAADGLDRDGSRLLSALAKHPSTPPTGTASTGDPATAGGGGACDGQDGWVEHECTLAVSADGGYVLAALGAGEHAVVALMRGGSDAAPITGERLRAGDVVVGATVTAAGCFEPQPGPTSVRFRRRSPAAAAAAAGGRPGAVQPKFSQRSTQRCKACSCTITCMGRICNNKNILWHLAL